MTLPGSEPLSFGALSNTLIIRTMAWLYIYIYIYIYIHVYVFIYIYIYIYLYITNNQFYIKKFNLAWVHSLIIKNISISSNSVQSNSSNSVLFNPSRALSDATILGQSGDGSNANKEVLRIPQSPSVTGTSPSDGFVSYSGHLWGVFYPSAEVQLQSTVFFFHTHINSNPYLPQVKHVWSSDEMESIMIFSGEIDLEWQFTQVWVSL